LRATKTHKTTMTEMNSATAPQPQTAACWSQPASAAQPTPTPTPTPPAEPPQPSLRNALVDLVSNYRRPALLADPGGKVVARSSDAEQHLSGDEQTLSSWPHFEIEVRTEDGNYTLMIPELTESEAPLSPRNVQLPPRLAKIARLVISGCTDKQIATRTGLSFSTVRTYVRQIYRRLNVHSRVELVHATSMGLTIE